MFQYFKCYLTSLLVGLHVIFVDWFEDEVGFIHRLLNNIRHLEEATFSLSECQVHHLVGGIQYTWHIAPFLHCLVCQAEIREALQIGLLESEVVGLEEVQTWHIAQDKSMHTV